MGRPRTFDEDIAVDRVMDVFWRKGYRGTTPQDLADAIGVGKGSLYNAFGSKRELFTRALDRYRDQQAVLVDQALGAPGPIKERIATALELMIDMNFADPDRRGCLAVNTAGAGRVRRGCDRAVRDVRAHCRHVPGRDPGRAGVG